ncbi:heme-binding protein [Bacteriovorax stolpii]|uniref:Heme-binding protein n=2 Tax=Bacteriovorax stolpii TaxID=960 RepID=A0A2K9NRT6_BACTC|nr:heme-binding protein [Bacteriovorax stolpii]
MEVVMNQEKVTLDIPLSEKLKGIPGFFGIRLGEEPFYEVVCTEGDKEIRKYNSFILASVTINGNFEEVKKEAFACLASYIFGQNKDHKHLKMTSPVLQEETNDYIPMTSPIYQGPNSNGWTMSFVLPQKYNLATAPTPKDNRILLHKSPERMVASLRYSGANDQEKIKKFSAELVQWISKSDLFFPVGDIQIAQYDGPTTIPFLRRNEVHVEVKQFF